MTANAKRDAIVSLMIPFVWLVPQLWFMLQPSYAGIYPAISSDEQHYVATIREVSEGRVLHANSYLYEEKSGPTSLFMASEIPLGFLFRLWPFGVAAFVFFFKWMGAAASIFLLLRLVRRAVPSLNGSWRLTAVMGFFVLPMMLGPGLAQRFFASLVGSGPWTEGLNWLRFVNPVLSGVLFLSALVLLYDLLERLSLRTYPHQWRLSLHVIAVGAFVGLSSWFYVYFWMFLSVFLGVCLLLSVLRRDWSGAIRLAFALAIDGLAALPYLLFVRWQFAHAIFNVSSPVASHAPIFEKAVIVSVFLFLVLWIISRPNRRAPLSVQEFFLLSLSVTVLAAVNQHVITGRMLQPHHFYFLIDLPIAGMLLMIGLGLMCQRFFVRPFLSRSVPVIATVVLAWAGTGVQAGSVKQAWTDLSDEERYAPALTEIRREAYPNVILADERGAELIPMYTQADVYFAPHAATYGSTSQERRRQALFVEYRLEGITDPIQIRQKFEQDKARISTWLFEALYYRDRCGSALCIPDAVLADLEHDYRIFLKNDFASELKNYRVDEILWDGIKHPEWRLEQYPFLRKIWEGDRMSLWRFLN